MNIAMRAPNRTPTVQGPVYETVVDHEIVTHDAAPVFLSARAAKRAFDIVAATLGLILLSPMFLLVSIAIKTASRGPLFCPQPMRGCNNENIAFLKFRTTVFSGAGKGTSIVTRVGGVLHRTGLAGLPQLINVLRGDMSIVGPSQYVASHNISEQISPMQQRHRMKPGLTGWAQVNGCCEMRQRIEFDQQYIEDWSLLFDAKIILMALFSKDSYLN